MSARLPAAVLWDLDGTLVDSEAYWVLEERALVEDFGGVWTEADAFAPWQDAADRIESAA